MTGAELPFLAKVAIATTATAAGVQAYCSYQAGKEDLTSYLLSGDHAQRLIGMNLIKDIEYCFQWDLYDIVPELLDKEFSV